MAQAPGSPEEDPSGGFAFGGWQGAFDDDVVGAAVLDAIAGVDALLLGRRTYDIWSAYWPRHTGDPIGARFARVPKYVVSRGARSLRWAGSTRLGAHLPEEVAELRERHESIHVFGSLDLVGVLLAERLVDEVALWIHPVVLGSGKRLFPDGVVPSRFALLAPPVVGPSGAIQVRYRPDGEPTTGRVGPA